jgi:NTE family protein
VDCSVAADSAGRQHSVTTPRLALVLAGGGVAGIAWETGFLLGVRDECPSAASKLLDADVLLGTSAGSTVAAQISSGAGLAELFERQVVAQSSEILPDVGVDELLGLFEEAATQRDLTLTQRLQLIGKHALTARTVSEGVRRSVIAKRLPSHAWPDRPLLVTAIDAETGERVVFDRRAGVGLVDAVAASCAVPGVWPCVTIGSRRYMDGGIGSSANLDAVRDTEAIVMLAPTAEPGLSPFGGSLADEAAAHDGTVFGVFADKASLRAFGPNPLDPACRAPSATAGRDQGRRSAAEVAAFLGV